MQKQLTKQALVLLLASSLAAAAIGKERGSELATLPEYSNELSGWIRVEVAVFADSEAATLSAETWEHAPALRYPKSRRWLTRYDEINALMDQWGESAVTVNADGSIEVVPEPVIELLIEAALESDDPVAIGETAKERARDKMDDAPSDDADDVADIAGDLMLGIDEPYAKSDSETISLSEIDTSEKTDLAEALPTDALALTNDAALLSNDTSGTSSSNGSQVSMEDLFNEINTKSSAEIATAEGILKGDPMMAVDTEVLEDFAGTAAIDAVDIFNTGNLMDAKVQFGSMNSTFHDNTNQHSSGSYWLDGYVNDEEGIPDSDTLALKEAVPALPAPYQALTLEMLKQGLDKLQQQADRAPITALAWLQAPGDAGAPVVLDVWRQASDFPVIQGTIAFRRDEEVTVDVDLWLNTAGDYLPPRFEAINTPSVPKRVLIIETRPTDQGAVYDSQAPEPTNLPTGLNLDGSVSGVDELHGPTESANQISSPYRHAIAVSEQKDIREGYVRYIDHPTLQVVATWRELAFTEVYEIGESQRIRRDIDSLTRTLTAAPKTWVPRPQTAKTRSAGTITP